MKVFNSGKLIEDLQRLLSSDRYSCGYSCVLRKVCDDNSRDELGALCLVDKETFKQAVIDFYSHEVEG